MPSQVCHTQINLARFKQQIIKKKIKHHKLHFIQKALKMLPSLYAQIAPSVTESKYLWDEMQQLFHGARQRRGSEEYQHIELQLQGEFR